MSFRVGLTSVTFRKKTPREICDIASKNGVKYIEWGADVHATCPEAAKEIRKICDEYGIKSCSVGSYVRAGEGDIAAFTRDCESAAMLGAERVRIWLGGKGSADLSGDELEAIKRDVLNFAKKADEYGLVISFEFHKGTLSDNAASVMALIDDIGAPNVKTYWQPFSTGHDTEWLNAVAPYISAVHVFAWDENYVRYELSEQCDIWRGFIDILKQKANDPDLIFEFVKDDSDEQFAKDVKTLMEIM